MLTFNKKIKQKKFRMAAKRKRGFLRKFIIALLLILLAGGAIIAYELYSRVYQPNLSLGEKETTFFYISTGSNLSEVTNKLYEKNYIIDRNAFEWVAEKKNYKNHIHPGRYLLKDGMNNNELIDLLRSGKQVPVNVTFNNVRTKEDLAGKVGKRIEADSSRIIELLNDKKTVAEYGFNKLTILTMFIPNTYEFYWDTSAEEFLDRMAKEYKNFWTPQRREKAAEIDLSQSEVSILASIVQSEQALHPDERPRVAGLYINRLNRGMLLQSDPTVVYGLGDFTINRVLNKHLTFDSPYNTYMYKGLPPGPICLPEISSLKAVLNYEKHDYIFMCAKADFSGYHEFAKTLRQHNVYARRYQRELNKRRILN